MTENIRHIRRQMAEACERAGRNPESVRLLLATKTVSAENIRKALAAGETLIAENKVQELKEKFEDLKAIPHETHFIGHLQTNKIKEVLKYADCIQSVDRLPLAEKLQQRLAFEDRAIDVFLQVNTSYEESKFGVEPARALEFARQVAQLDRLRIKGLMTIGLFSADTEKVRKCFQLLRQIQQDVLALGIPAHALSMGMSGDFEVAIQEGATMVRVGTAIFGQRPHPDSYYWNEGK